VIASGSSRTWSLAHHYGAMAMLPPSTVVTSPLLYEAASRSPASHFRVGAKLRKAHYEQMFSALPPNTDAPAVILTTRRRVLNDGAAAFHKSEQRDPGYSSHDIAANISPYLQFPSRINFHPCWNHTTSAPPQVRMREKSGPVQ